MRFGIDLGGTKIELAALDDAGRERLRRRVPTPQGDYAATVAAIASLVREAEAQLDVRATVGVGIPGSPSPLDGRIRNANSTCLNGRLLRHDLEAALGRPVRLANDANCLAASEAADGAAAGARVVFGAILGTGVGGGIAVDAQPLAGLNAVAGEWGHNPLPWPLDDERPGPRCWCGRSGCIETWLSGPGFAADYGRAASLAGAARPARPPTGAPLPALPADASLPLPSAGRGADFVADVRPVDAATVVARMRAGDAQAGCAFTRYVDRLARSLAQVINLLDPDVIVLGGGMSNVDELYEQVPRAWGVRVFSDVVATPLRRASHGDSSGVRGAARLWP